jgi:hypothetical protein
MMNYKRIDASTYDIADMCEQAVQIYDITSHIVYDLLKEKYTNYIIIDMEDGIYRFTDKKITTEAALRLFDIDIDRLQVDRMCTDIPLDEILAMPVADVDICQIDIMPLIVA